MKEEKNVSTPLFVMDKKHFVDLSDAEQRREENAYWLTRSVEERFDCIEFLRWQWIEMNNLPTVMDKKYFDYRK